MIWAAKHSCNITVMVKSFFSFLFSGVTTMTGCADLRVATHPELSRLDTFTQESLQKASIALRERMVFEAWLQEQGFEAYFGRYRITSYGMKLLHDEVIKWKHFPRYWPFVQGIHWSPVNSLHKGQWHGSLMFSLICAWKNGSVNNRDAGDLRPHGIHYDVTVTFLLVFVCSHNNADGTRAPVNMSIHPSFLRSSIHPSWNILVYVWWLLK